VIGMVESGVAACPLKDGGLAPATPFQVQFVYSSGQQFAAEFETKRPMSDREETIPQPTNESAGQAITDVALDSHAQGVYDEESIQVLEGLEAVRKRPGMYVGDNGKKGLHQMFREVLDNSVDEALAGFCDRIVVTLHRDNSMSIEDNGRGIPVGPHPKMGISTLEVVMTVLHAGGKFGEGGGYKVSGGLHGVGVSCTNALSEWCEVRVRRDGKEYFQRYEAGKPQAAVQEVGKAKGSGTNTRWLADASVLTETEYDLHIVKSRLRELAYLNPTVTFEFVDEQDLEQNETYHYTRGIQQLVEDVNESKTALHKVIFFRRAKEAYEVEIALQYHDGYNQTILAFSNNIHQPDGGTHVSGFSAALTRIINAYARKNNVLKEKDKNFQADDVADGLTAVIALKLENPSYNSQDKVKLVTPEVQGIVNSLVGDGLSTFMDENPRIARAIVDKALTAQRAREAARKAFDAVKRSSAMDSFGLPGKLADCVSKEPEKCELFLVEGESAGGSAKGARDRMTQAIMGLKGKILNVERARLDKALDNEEIKSLIAALGIGFDVSLGRGSSEEADPMAVETEESEPQSASANGNGKEHGLDITKLRYHKIIIMTDADVDGEHIRTLLLTFFYRYMRPLIEHGHIYLAQPPLFVIKAGVNERYYAMSNEERDEILKNLSRKKEPHVTRFKGLGEMNAEELEETTMNPENRRLLKVVLDPEFEMEIEMMFSRLMGEKVEPRREFIERHAKEALDLDWHY
ncbi:MAG TPA: DNA topoisomerase subunit B, partial [Fimbriimonadaceae bacterium]|nr:DNA topoisomerase subunit B [Fimbriimonadaceae bacterium]